MIGDYTLELIGKDGEVKWKNNYKSEDFDLQGLYTKIMTKIKDTQQPTPEELGDVVVDSEDSLKISYESGE